MHYGPISVLCFVTFALFPSPGVQTTKMNLPSSRLFPGPPSDTTLAVVSLLHPVTLHLL